MKYKVWESLRFFRHRVTDTFPFTLEFNRGRICLSVPNYSRIFTREGLVWEKIHDGSRLADHGVLFSQPNLELSLPVGQQVRVLAEGKTWIIKGEEDHRLLKTAKDLKVARKGLGLSVLFHVGLLGSLLLWVNHGSEQEELSFAEKLRADKLAELIELEKQYGLGSNSPVPFSGVSYRQYLRAMEEQANPSARLDKLVGSLSSLNFGEKKSANSPATNLTFLSSAKELLDRLRSNSNAENHALSDLVQNQKFNYNEEQSSKQNSKVSNEDRALIKERFAELQEEFRKVYNRILTSDSDFNVTVGFEVSVLPSGQLKLASFSPRGNYRPESIRALQTGMAVIVERAKLSKNLAGIVIRGENVFIKQ